MLALNKGHQDSQALLRGISDRAGTVTNSLDSVSHDIIV